MNAFLSFLLVTATLLASAQVTTDIEDVRPSAVFSVQLVDGKKLTGSLDDWKDNEIALGMKVLPLEEVASIARPDSFKRTPFTGPSAMIGLTDGSQLVVHDLVFGAEGEDFKSCRFVFQSTSMRMPTEYIRFVRFVKPTAALREQWVEIGDAKHTGDVVVVRRSAESIDSLEGVIRGIAEDKVMFEFEGEVIPVEIRKLEGIFFYHLEPAKSVKSPVIRFSFPVAGHMQERSVIHARSATWDDDSGQLLIETESEAVIPMAWSDLERIDFTSGRVTYLSDLEPTLEEVTPSVGSQVSRDAVVGFLYAPRRNESFSGQSLLLNFPEDGEEKSYARGLAVHSRTRLEFRIGGKYQRLKGTVGLEPHPAQSGSVRLIIRVDGEEALNQLILRGDEPVQLDVSVADANDLEMLVDYGEDGDAGDRLHLCELRVVK